MRQPTPPIAAGNAASPASRELVRLVALVVFAQTCALFLRSWLQITLQDGGMAKGQAANLSYLVVPPVLALLLYPVWRKRICHFKALLRPVDLTWRIALLGAGLGVALRLAWWGWLIASVAFGWRQNNSQLAIAGPLITFSCPPLQLIAFHLLTLTLLVPLVEEIVNRGLLLEWFMRYGQAAAIAGSAILFTAFHPVDSFGWAFLFGVLSGIMYLGNRTLWGVLLAHGTFNGLIVIDWLCLNTIWNPSQSTPGLTALGAIAIALTLVSLCLSMFLVSKKVTGACSGDFIRVS